MVPGAEDSKVMFLGKRIWRELALGQQGSGMECTGSEPRKVDG